MGQLQNQAHQQACCKTIHSHADPQYSIEYQVACFVPVSVLCSKGCRPAAQEREPMKSRFTCSPTFELGRYFVLPVGGQSCQVEAEIPAGHQPEHVVCRQGRGHRMIEHKKQSRAAAELSRLECGSANAQPIGTPCAIRAPDKDVGATTVNYARVIGGAMATLALAVGLIMTDHSMREEMRSASAEKRNKAFTGLSGQTWKILQGH
jgi:hypothetical protein